MRIVCAMIGHQRERRRVWHDGRDFRSACRFCGADLVREEAGRTTWRRFDPTADFHPDRRMKRVDG